MSAGRVIVYGGRGALGSTVVAAFKKNKYWVCNIDMMENTEADHNILVSGDSWLQQEENVCKEVASVLAEEKLEALLCLAGGWAGGSPGSQDFIKNAEMMWRSSVWPSSITARLACSHLREGGLVVLPGAQPALKGTPTMAGYGMAKAAVHQLVASLAGSQSGLPKDCTSLAILPNTLDTPMNRKWMSSADTSTWTPLGYVADLMLTWTRGVSRPQSGGLVSLVTQGGVTTTSVN